MLPPVGALCCILLSAVFLLCLPLCGQPWQIKGSANGNSDRTTGFRWNCGQVRQLVINGRHSDPNPSIGNAGGRPAVVPLTRTPPGTALLATSPSPGREVAGKAREARLAVPAIRKEMLLQPVVRWKLHRPPRISPRPCVKVLLLSQKRCPEQARQELPWLSNWQATSPLCLLPKRSRPRMARLRRMQSLPPPWPRSIIGSRRKCPSNENSLSERRLGWPMLNRHMRRPLKPWRKPRPTWLFGRKTSRRACSSRLASRQLDVGRREGGGF
jgi:hypothetical protein